LNRKEQLIEKLCARWNAPTPQLAINEALGAAFPNLYELSLPVRLSHLALQRGVVDIYKKQMNFDGIISANSKGSYIIQVNRDHPESRRRFTIAHELGHTFFFELDGGIGQRVRDTNLYGISRSDSEEVLCNYAAAEILMPRRQFGAMIRDSGPSSESIIRLARSFNVSLQAVSKRALQLLPYKLVIILWQYNPTDKTYHSKWATGVTLTNRRATVRLVVGPQDPAFKFFHAQDNYRGRVWISLDGPLEDYFVDAIAWRNGTTRKVLTVFVLERNPRALLANCPIRASQETQMSLF